jgi:histidinol-phosphate aminotransferase
MDIQNLLRFNIRNLKGYSSAREEFTGREGIFLDANENPFGTLNRYPDPYQKQLKKRISELKGISSEQMCLGNGSDELIDLIIRSFCNPKEDKMLCFAPSYGMYEVAAAIQDIECVQLKLNADFQLDAQIIAEALAMQNIKIMMLCSPNNPTGNCLSSDFIEQLLNNFRGIVVIDEAYIEFSKNSSWTQKLTQFPNLIVLQTLSKAWGLAAARVGIAFASAEIIQVLNKVKAPYNMSLLNQDAALKALKNVEAFKQNIQCILEQKERLIAALASNRLTEKIYPSDANFLLVKFKNAAQLFESLISQGIIVRNRTQVVENCLRISIGNPEETTTLINALKNEENTFFG